MSENLVLDLSMQFAIDVVNLCETLKGKNSLTNQLLRSGTSIGANVAEAIYGSSRKDFVAKLQIARKEAAETAYWLELLYKSSFLTKDQYSSMQNDCRELMAMLSSSIKNCEE